MTGSPIRIAPTFFSPLLLATLMVLSPFAGADDFVFSREQVVMPHRFDGYTVLDEYDGRDGTPEWWIVR